MFRISIAAMLLLAGSASQAAPGDRPVSLAVSGEGKWQTWCHITPESGEEYVRALEPGRATFTSPNMRRATCKFQSTSAGPITIEGDAWACPFPVVGGGACAKTAARSTFGDFEIKRKR